MKKLLPLLFAVLFSTGTFAQRTWYVDVNNTTPNPNGTSWAQALTSIQAAIDSSFGTIDVDSIFVKAGTYKQNARIFNHDVHLFGGFAGTETYAAQANPEVNITTLDADINGDDIVGSTNNKSDNLSYLVYIQFTSVPLHISGFTFRNGYNTNSWAQRGGAIVIRDGNSETECYISKCKFYNNKAMTEGGAIYTGSTTTNRKVTTHVDKCWFEGNSCGTRGAAIFNYSFSSSSAIATLNVTNSVFTANTDPSPDLPAVVYNGTSSGGGLTQCNLINNSFVNNNCAAVLVFNGTSGVNNSSNLLFQNNIVWTTLNRNTHFYIGNSSVAANNHAVTIKNNTLYNGQASITNSTNATVVFSNNSSTNPSLNNIASKDFKLTDNSSAINAGDTSNISSYYRDSKDYLGATRFFSTAVDHGAFESNVILSMSKELMETKKLVIFPNPACSSINILDAGGEQVIFYNAVGQIVKVIPTQENLIVDISELQSGVYFIASGQAIQKFVKK